MELRSRLYFVAGAQPAGRSSRQLTEAALAGGAGLVQYDGAGLSTADMVCEAAELVWACRKAKVPLLINRRCDVALAVMADGVHVGPEDMPVALARRLMGPASIVGVTVAGLADAREAQKQGATYVSFGPVFAPPPAHDAPGLAALAEIRAALDLPVCAYGGIRLENVDQLRHTPADLVAITSPLTTAANPLAVTRELVARLQRPQPG